VKTTSFDTAGWDGLFCGYTVQSCCFQLPNL
jgi:hypothetical protein